jgi:hypothetical protein
MKGAQAFDDLEGLKTFLENQVKNLKNEIYPSHNPVFSKSIKKKIRFVEWILKLLKSNEFTHAQLVEIIDIKMDKLKKELNRARVRTHTDRLYDSIQSLEWLRYVLSSTNRGASFIYGIHYFLPFLFTHPISYSCL